MSGLLFHLAQHLARKLVLDGNLPADAARSAAAEYSLPDVDRDTLIERLEADPSAGGTLAGADGEASAFTAGSGAPRPASASVLFEQAKETARVQFDSRPDEQQQVDALRDMDNYRLKRESR